MRRIFYLLMMLLLLCAPAWADQPTTVLTRQVADSSKTIDIPVIDGANNEVFQTNANSLLARTAEDLAKKLGKDAHVTYQVGLNRPSLVSVLFIGTNGGKRYEKALNVDLTSGQEFGLDDFFFSGEQRDAVLGREGKDYHSVYFTDDGIYTSAKEGEPYNRFHSYGALMAIMRMGDAGRLVTVWKLTEACADTVFTVPAGSLFAMKLAANPTTGNQWIPTITGGPKDGLFKTGSVFTLPGNAPREQIGAPGTEIQFYTAQIPGTYQVRLNYQKPWDKLGGFRYFSFTVVVK